VTDGGVGSSAWLGVVTQELRITQSVGLFFQHEHFALEFRSDVALLYPTSIAANSHALRRLVLPWSSVHISRATRLFFGLVEHGCRRISRGLILPFSDRR
jgi:hypothetical protein